MIKSKKIRGGLYELARSAKERLRNNNYLKQTNNVVSIHTTTIYQNNVQKVKQQKPIQKVNTLDEILYKKVCEIIENKRDILNPVNELIDRKLFNTLEVSQKQHYINTLIEKYKILKQRYYKEHMQNQYQINY